MKNTPKFIKGIVKFFKTIFTKTLPRYWMQIVLSIAVLVALCLIFRNNYSEIIGTITGYLIAVIGHSVIKAFLNLREDKNKIASHGFPNNKDYYCKTVNIGGKSTEIWYEALGYEGEIKYHIEKDGSKKYFTLDPILLENYTKIMHAHDASYISNKLMIRLDDFEYKDGTYNLCTSRTAFYNDLVTNRSMDYVFEGNLTVRDIFESNNFLFPLNESKMSNHIGYGVMIFHGNAMLLAFRSMDATLSKNQLTAGLAFGLAEDFVIQAHDPLEEDKQEKNTVEKDKRKHNSQEETVKIKYKPFIERDPKIDESDLCVGVILVRLADALNKSLKEVRELYENGKIKIHSLGFGRLIYTGGKPQFYFALVIDKDVDLSSAKDKKLRDKNERIDFDKDMIFATNISLKKEGGYVLDLELQNKKRHMKKEAEKSFFINYWHLLQRPPIEGVPDWVYGNKIEI